MYQAGAFSQKLADADADADGQTDGQASRLKMTVTGNSRQIQLAVEAVLLAGKTCVAGISATATGCEKSDYYNRQTRLPRKNDRGQQGFGLWLTVGDVQDRRRVFIEWVDAEDRGPRQCRRRMTMQVEQLRRKRSSNSSSKHRKKPIWMVCETGKWRRGARRIGMGMGMRGARGPAHVQSSPVQSNPVQSSRAHGTVGRQARLPTGYDSTENTLL